MSNTIPTVQSMEASNFLGSIGVNTHVVYYDTTYANINGVVADMGYLGLNQVRDGAPVWQGGQGWWHSYQTAMDAGLKFDLLIPANQLDVANDIAMLNGLEASEPGAINAIEGINEANAGTSFDGLTGEAAANQFQQQLFTAVHQDTALNGVSVYNYTAGADPYTASTYTQFGNISGETNFGNAHVYTGGGSPDGAAWFLNLQLAGTPNDPYVITETGFDTMPGTDRNDGSMGVNDDVQAKYTLDDVFDAIKGGASTVYLYELLDERSDPGMTDHEDHFGLFNADGTPKPAAVAIHNLTTILADPGAAANTSPAPSLAYSIANLPSTGNSLLLAKSDGSFDLAVWAEPQIWNGTTDTEITVAPTPVTINLGQMAGHVEIFDPLLGTAPIASFLDVSQVTIALGASPLIIEIDPVTAAASMASASPFQPVSIGSGADQIDLRMSEDYYLANAQFTVAVDGVTIGGVESVVASHAAGQDQDVLVNGNFGSGAHTISIDFLNDAYAGTPQTDRNLFVDSASFDGVAIQNGSLGLYGQGAQTITTSVAVAPAAPQSDTLDLKMDEDYYQGDAQFTISVDGQEVGGVQSVQATRASGQPQDVVVTGNWGAGPHTVAVDFLNDLYAGTAATDRNLFVEGASYDGVTVQGVGIGLYSDGTGVFSTQPGAPQSLGTGADTLDLKMSEDAYLGDAQFTVSVDGQQVGSVLSVQAAHANGADQDVFVKGDWGAGPHSVTVDFLNDLYAGTIQTDRNLYVDASSYDGVSIVGGSLGLYASGPQMLNFVSSTTFNPGAAGGTVTTQGNDTVDAGSGSISVFAGGPSTTVAGSSGSISFIALGGNDTIVAGSGAVMVTGNTGSLTFTEGSGTANVTLGSGAAVFNLINGQSGGSLTISGFTPGADLLHLQGYAGSGIASQQVAAGSTQLLLTDNTQITLTGVTGTGGHALFG